MRYGKGVAFVMTLPGVRIYATHVLVDTTVQPLTCIDSERTFLKEVMAGCGALFYLGEGMYDICSKNKGHKTRCGPIDFMARLSIPPSPELHELPGRSLEPSSPPDSFSL